MKLALGEKVNVRPDHLRVRLRGELWDALRFSMWVSLRRDLWVSLRRGLRNGLWANLEEKR